MYNGLGDRVLQTFQGRFCRLDHHLRPRLNAGLTQVLSQTVTANSTITTSTYLYGVSRIGELQSSGFIYHLGDALGSVRQLTDATVSNKALSWLREAYRVPKIAWSVSHAGQPPLGRTSA